MLSAAHAVRTIAALLMAVLALCAAPAFAAPSAAAAPAFTAADYRLGTGDKVRVIVFGEGDLGGQYEVDATGYVRLPLVGQVQAGGLTAHDLESRITAALANGYLNDPHVSVEVSAYRPFFVVGEVQKPGQYSYMNGTTAASAVAMAGGFTNRAVQSTIYVRHQGVGEEQQLTVSDGTPIQPGDVLRVKTSPLWTVLDVVSPLTGLGATVRYSIP